MKKLCVIMLVVILTTYANAILKPGLERPIRHAKMKKVEGSGYFLQAENVTLTLTKRDESKKPTGIVFKYELPNPECVNDGMCPPPSLFTVTMDIFKIEEAYDSSVYYYAKVINSNISAGSVNSTPHNGIAKPSKIEYSVILWARGKEYDNEWVGNVTRMSQYNQVTTYSVITFNGIPSEVYTAQ